ncbi:MAG TPA: hybrid sensor histidine kinase/response regulator [Polyangiaceae bacterium]|nr:hybrid sensor histidine kinase/response regulator [Polyangiaceae bacterium]
MEISKAKILVVDDNAQNRELARATLEDEGYEVLLASGGEEGIRTVEAQRPDCVLLDVRMPGTDGFAVCTRIRALPDAGDTPVVFLTALRDVDTFDQALRAGGDDFLTKPVRPTELVLRVAAALKLRRMNAELREHYDLVRRQRDDLIRLQLQKERLSSFVVHDLKNPVNSLDLHAQLLLRQADLPPRARDSVLHIRAEARSLLRLILNLLDISKSEEGRLSARLAPVGLEALSAEIVDAFTIRAEAARVTLKRNLSVDSVVADADLLRRVLENLIDNGLRHSPPGSTLTLSATRRDGAIELRVADQGRGIPVEQRDEIFEPFVQGSKEQLLTRTGRGLGLTFCRLAVQTQGGNIRIEDANPGAAFCVVLPDVAPSSP